MLADPRIPKLVSVADAAAMLGVNRQRVWQLIQSGQLPAVKVARDIILSEQAVRDYDTARNPR